MNIKYSTSEMGFEGYFPVNYPNLRVLETQLLYLEAYHLPIQKIITEGKTYKGSLLYNIGKGGFEKPYISELYHHHHNIVAQLKEKFEEVYIYQDGEIGWWNQVDTRLQAWWYNQLIASDGILVPNSTDVPFYKGIFPTKKIKVIRSVMTDEGLDKTKFKPQENRTIVTGPLTREYNGFSQLLLAHNLDMPVDIPPMGESRMPKDSWEMAPNLGVNYLQYMSWAEWMYNLSRYKVGYMMSAATASGSFALNCAYLGIPCIGDKRADTQSILFPDLAVDVFDNEKALKLTFKLKNDLDFYLEVSNKAKELYKKEFTKEKMLELLQND
tara:strand:- start:1011 stop:1988 length:978 start_codon:yes stop_codon:yes gene_type:complete